MAYLERPQPGRPAGWENVASEGLELARRAAEADAFAALLDEAYGLKVTHARRLREFLESGNAVRDTVEALLRRDSTVKIDLEPDQVAVASVRIGMRELMRILTRAFEDHYKGDQFAAADFREMVLLAGREDLAASGLATPPEATILRNRYAPIEYNAPEWAATKVAAVGRYEPGDGETLDKTAQVTGAPPRRARRAAVQSRSAGYAARRYRSGIPGVASGLEKRHCAFPERCTPHRRA